jgi:hypothetical protein
MELTFKYKAGSDLPRRTFVVDTTVAWTDDSVTYVQYTVTAPDFGAAEMVVRRLLNEALAVDSFRFNMVREVMTDGWNAERGDYSAVVVRVPFLYRPVVNHR